MGKINSSTENDVLNQPAFRVTFATEKSELAADPGCVAESKLAESTPNKIGIGLIAFATSNATKTTDMI